MTREFGARRDEAIFRELVALFVHDLTQHNEKSPDEVMARFLELCAKHHYSADAQVAILTEALESLVPLFKTPTPRVVQATRLVLRAALEHVVGKNAGDAP